jgi:uncharacterized damage-inducible protein DinB
MRPAKGDTKMTEMIEPMLIEFREEAAITRRILERVPADKLSWKPHPKSMSLGQLASHIARIPGTFAPIGQSEEFEFPVSGFEPAVPKNFEAIHSAFEQSVRAAEACLEAMSEETALGVWRMKVNGKVILSKSRVDVLRKLMLNHWYHHRGQLSVYLRLLDVPLPVIYGRSADQNPFA